MSFERQINSYPTVGQLEREIAQKINSLYYIQFSHRASRVDCHLFDRKLIIFFEDVITAVEQTLRGAATSTVNLDQVRTLLDAAIKPKMEQLIQDITQVQVNRFIYNTNSETGSAIAIVILASAPQVRHKKSNRRKNVLQFNKQKKRFDYGDRDHSVASSQIKVSLEHEDIHKDIKSNI
ncbi:MAG TPA: DUF2294 domain-containing protein [Coleofasciculaceae cyanobacterium]|jgi:uncharacterized protein YbcI